MAQDKLNQGAPTPERLEASLRAWKLILRVSAVQCVVIAVIAAAVHKPAISVIVLAIGAVSIPLRWRYLKARHRALITEATGGPSGDPARGSADPFGPTL
jgi:hypothetical protein